VQGSGDRRYAAYLLTRYREILAYLGDACLVVGVVVLAPLLALPLHPEEREAALALLLSGAGAVAVGVALRLQRGSAAPPTLNFQEGSVLVVSAWLVAVAAGAAPFFAIEGMTWSRAVFESTSGWTTTGLSIVDTNVTPRLLLLHRSTIQFAGGTGFAVVVLSSLGGPTGTGLGTAEGRTDLLVPSMRRSARLVLLLYSAYAALGVLGFRAAGMDWFDSVNHSFTAVSTGGFSTRMESLGWWDDPVIEAVAIVLMLLGTTNFVTTWTLLRGRFRAFARNGEIRLTALLLPLSAVVLFAGVTIPLYAGLGKAARVAVFESVTALSTTGFSTVGYGNWNPLGWSVLILLMIVGGGTGSTAGGLKQYRAYALWRALLCEVRRMFQPTAVFEPDVQVGDRRRFLSDADVRGIGVYAFLYVALLGLGTAALAACGHPLRDALFEFTSALGTVGITSGISSPTTPPATQWILTTGMFLGRLEVLIVVLFLVKLGQHARAILRR
jgi:trk system potassium uptake protein TrkH